MSRFLLLCLLAGGAWAQNAPLSPFELAAAVEASAPVDWAGVWERMKAGVPPKDLPHCGDPRYSACTTELITVLNPEQTILLVQSDARDADYYLRFLKDGAAWKFAGAHLARLQYYPRRHEMARLAGKPYLRISVQGEAGSTLSSEVEEWMDLSGPGFEPVLTFPARGHSAFLPGEIVREISAYAKQENNGENVLLDLTVRFSFAAHDLGEMNFAGVYARPEGKRSFELQRAYIRPSSSARAAIPNEEFTALLQMYEGPNWRTCSPTRCRA